MHHLILWALVLLAGCSQTPAPPPGDALPTDANLVPVDGGTYLKRMGSWDGSLRFRLYWLRIDQDNTQTLIEVVADCQKRTYVALSRRLYGPDGKVKDSWKAPTRTFDPAAEEAPVPETAGELGLDLVCLPPPSPQAH